MKATLKSWGIVFLKPGQYVPDSIETLSIPHALSKYILNNKLDVGEREVLAKGGRDRNVRAFAFRGLAFYAFEEDLIIEFSGGELCIDSSAQVATLSGFSDRSA